jgi:histidine triad (HIT) family protein
MSDEKKCVFCDIKESINTRIIEETKNTYTILSNPALMKGHCLVIPKKHVESLSELNDDVRQELFEQVVRMQSLLIRKFMGCDIRQNYRPFQKQDDLKINHLYIHLQPRELYDELYEKCMIYEKDVFKKLSQEQLDEDKEFVLREVKV